MFNRNIISTICLLAGVVWFNALQAQVRTYSNEFLALGVGARAFAMGNAQCAAANGVYAAYWNTAAIANTDAAQLGLMHAEWFAGVAKYDYAGFIAPLANKQRAVGLSLIRFGVDDIPNTLTLVEPDGSFNYDNLSVFSAADYAALLHYAQAWSRWQVGGSAKVIYRKVGKFANAWGLGIDVGVRFAATENLTLAVAVKDLTTTYNAWSFNFTEEEKLQLQATDNLIPVKSVELTGQRLVLGIAHRLNFGEKLALTTALDIDCTFDGKRNVLLGSDFVSIDPHAGAELSYNNTVFLRGGVNKIQRFTDDNDLSKEILSVQPNVGIGFKIDKVTLDYAFVGLNRRDVGIFSHVISLALAFNSKVATNDTAPLY